jgi:hypothetical protein
MVLRSGFSVRGREALEQGLQLAFDRAGLRTRPERRAGELAGRRGLEGAAEQSVLDL